MALCEKYPQGFSSDEFFCQEIILCRDSSNCIVKYCFFEDIERFVCSNFEYVVKKDFSVQEYNVSVPFPLS
jgi:hypothetical protein